ncbi:MAG: transposase [Micrococcaceae bacterium]|nr:transposase [Micrococcaceae bacterium]
MRYTAFATNQISADIAALELRHRRRTRDEDRIRNAKDTGLTNLPMYSLAANGVWTHLIKLVGKITAYTQMLTFADAPARLWELKQLWTRIF